MENVEGWLFRIAHNASLDFLRRRARNTVIPLTEDVEATPVLLEWRNDGIVAIRDFLFAPYVLEVIDWGRLG